jgi:hypothetical protein
VADTTEVVWGCALVLDLTLLQIPRGLQMRQHIEIAHPAEAGIKGEGVIAWVFRFSSHLHVCNPGIIYKSSFV